MCTINMYKCGVNIIFCNSINQARLSGLQIIHLQAYSYYARKSSWLRSFLFYRSLCTSYGNTAVFFVLPNEIDSNSKVVFLSVVWSVNSTADVKICCVQSPKVAAGCFLTHQMQTSDMVRPFTLLIVVSVCCHVQIFFVAGISV